MAVNLSTLLNSSFVVNGGPLDGLSDVVIGTPNTLTNGDSLVYNGTNWINDPKFNTYLLPITRQTDTTDIVAISVSTTAPSSPAVGDLWVDTN